MYSIKEQLIQELITTITNLNAKSDLLCIVCSYGDTLSDEKILEQLKEWNKVNSNTANNS